MEGSGAEGEKEYVIEKNCTKLLNSLIFHINKNMVSNM